MSRQQDLAQELAAELVTSIGDMSADTAALANGLPLEALLLDGVDDQRQASARQTVTRMLHALLEAKPTYLQARLIDADSGQELVRVDRPHAGLPIRTVPTEALQTKAHRPYVQAGVKLAPNARFVSPIELNMEHGEVAEPRVPVIRAVSPVFVDEKRRGLVVVNVDLGPALAQVAAFAADGDRRYVVDSSGQFLLHPNPTWCFDPSRTLAAAFPALAPALQSGVAATAVSELEDTELLTAMAPVHLAGDRRVAVIAARHDVLGSLSTDVRFGAAAAAAVALLISTFLALLWSRRVTEPLGAITEAAELIGQGIQPDLPVGETGEIGVLARALVTMQGQLFDRQQSIVQERERFQVIFEQAAGPMVMVTHDGTIVLANRQMARLFGYEVAELVSQPLSMLLPEDIRAPHQDHLAQFAAKPSVRKMGAGRDLFGLHKSGELIALEIGLAPLVGPTGRRRVLASVVDIRDRVSREQELMRSNAELERFAYVASHDLQEPLRMVANFTELLQRRYGDQLDERAQGYIHYAADGARRMRDLIRDLLAYSRVGADDAAMEPVDLNVVLEGLRRSMQVTLAEVGGTLEAEPLPAVLGDAQLLTQLLQNLISNALKFRAEGRPPRIVIAARPEGDHNVRVSVTDNGIGVAPEHRERVFEMFQRLHEVGAYEGSGIGLAIVRRIVDRHGGSITLDSAEGGGTVVAFTLQRAPVDV